MLFALHLNGDSEQLSDIQMLYPDVIKPSHCLFSLHLYGLLFSYGRCKKQPVEERLCPECKCVEDEVHFLTECELFSITRENLSKMLG